MGLTVKAIGRVLEEVPSSSEATYAKARFDDDGGSEKLTLQRQNGIRWKRLVWAKTGMHADIYIIIHLKITPR